MVHFSYYIVNKVGVIQIDGEITVRTVNSINQDIKPLIKEVSDGNLNGIVMDCKKVTHIDSAGFGSICAKFLSLKKLKSKMGVVNLKSNTLTLFEILNLTDVFETGSSLQGLIYKIGPKTFDADAGIPAGNWKPSVKPKKTPADRSLNDINLNTVILKPSKRFK